MTQVLDKGEVVLLETFGDELTIVNAARASFGTVKNVIDDSDRNLIRYLLDNEHWSPFRHCMMRFQIKAPEFVLRQMFRHIVGIEATSTYSTQLHAWSERSGRYKIVDEYYYPREWRTQSLNLKQGSDGLMSGDAITKAQTIYDDAMLHVLKAYDQLLSLGVAREQARIILPLAQYNTVIWTCSLEALIHFIDQRYTDHAQQEIRDYAAVFDSIVATKFPTVYETLAR